MRLNDSRALIGPATPFTMRVTSWIIRARFSAVLRHGSQC